MTDTTDFADFTDVTEDITAYNEIAEQLTRDTAPEIPDVPEPRDVFYRLPGGLVVDGRPVYEFEVRELPGEDEERIHKARTSAESRRMRFHGPFHLDESNVGRFTDFDRSQQFALVATRELERRAELSSRAPMVLDAPSLDGAVNDLDGLLRLVDHLRDDDGPSSIGQN
jgi:hypothetical protein